VKGEVNSNFATSTSTSESTSSASTYAQEVIDKSLQKIIERVREERTVTTLVETEETNTHTFDNILGTGHVIGIYRFVDKLYKAQIVNYGKRLFLEFLVPEPAAFYVYAQANEDLEGVTLEEPTDPGNLTPFDINETNYQTWVSKYNVQDVAPPPARYAVVGTSAEMKHNQDLAAGALVTTALKDLLLPPGYAAVTTYCHAVNVKAAAAPSDPAFLVSVAWQQFDMATSSTAEQAFLDPDNEVAAPSTAFSGAIPISVLTANYSAWTLNIEILCERTDEAYREWQLATYQKVMAAYNLAKAEYDNQVAQAKTAMQLQAAGVVLTPEAKRELERRELQRGCITLFAGDYFDQYDATKLQSSQEYPEFDLAEAANEGTRAQFFQQAFQWEDMTYLFYPYFWGRKDNWVDVLRLDDDDPVFAGFLKAGYARVVVPVRQAYEAAVLFFLQSKGWIWNGGGAPTLYEPLYVSIVDELTGPVGRPQGEPWEVAVPTTLVILDESSELPDWTVEPEPETEVETVP
jgi:hypothetical protein